MILDVIELDWLEIKEFFKDTFKYILLVVFILFLIVYVVTLNQVIGPSMSPNFNNGDIVMLDKVTYRFKDIKRGDVVSLNYSDTKYLIKRIIGLPGESVEIKNNTVYINGLILDEFYLDNLEYSDFNLNELGYEKIPDGYYFVMGDNRINSLDSRDSKVGLISKKDIIGKVRARIWPINKFKIIK